MLSSLPKFIIKKNSQKGGYFFDQILNASILKDVCQKITGIEDFTVEFDSEGYNKGRLALLYFKGAKYYISFSETGDITARNSFFQSLTTALVTFKKDNTINKNIFFYYLPLKGSIETDYFKFLYRLMHTAGVIFLNQEQYIKYNIVPFNSIADLIANRTLNRAKNSGNNSTYITKNTLGITEIYAKTYGASKKEAVLLSIVASEISNEVDLYEIIEQDLKELPGPDKELLQSLGNIKIITTNKNFEKQIFEKNESIRSPRFNYNLLSKLGPKKCFFCDCNLPELIEGAHIYPVSEIKKLALTLDEKLALSTDEDNGLWLCSNHHKMYDTNLINIDENFTIKIKEQINVEYLPYIKNITNINSLDKSICNDKLLSFINKRNIIIEHQYISL